MIIINCILWCLIFTNAVLVVFNIKTHKKQIKMCISEKEKLYQDFDNELKRIKENLDNELKTLQPLQDKQQNCKRGEWCKACNFNKEYCISAYSHILNCGVPYSYHYCAKGICQEFIERKETL